MQLYKKIILIRCLRMIYLMFNFFCYHNKKHIFAKHFFGDVAQLVRVLAWQARSRGFESHLLHKSRLFKAAFYFPLFKSSATFSSSEYQSSPNFRINASFTNLYTGTSSSFPNEHAGLQISQRS